jgi:hypothetical protein
MLPSGGLRRNEPSLLTGILFDAQGGRMSPTHATKRGTRYRYYISRSLLGGRRKPEPTGNDSRRLPMSLLSLAFAAGLLTPPPALSLVQHATSGAATQKRLIECAKDIDAERSVPARTSAPARMNNLHWLSACFTARLWGILRPRIPANSGWRLPAGRAGSHLRSSRVSAFPRIATNSGRSRSAASSQL